MNSPKTKTWISPEELQIAVLRDQLATVKAERDVALKKMAHLRKVMIKIAASPPQHPIAPLISEMAHNAVEATK